MNADTATVFLAVNIGVAIALWWPHRRGTLLLIARRVRWVRLPEERVGGVMDEIPERARQLLGELAAAGATREVFEERAGPFRVATAFFYARPDALVVVRRLAGGSWRLEAVTGDLGRLAVVGGDGVAVDEGDFKYVPVYAEEVEALLREAKRLVEWSGSGPLVAKYFEARNRLYRRHWGELFRRDLIMVFLAVAIIGVNVYGLLASSL